MSGPTNLDPENITRAGISAEYVGTRSLGSRERLYAVATEFGTYRIFQDSGSWAIYTPSEPSADNEPTLAAGSTKTEALARVAADVLSRRATEQAVSPSPEDHYDPFSDGCDNCGGEDHTAEVCPLFKSKAEYDAHVASRREDADLCVVCSVPEHESCAMDQGCRCCRDTMEGVEGR